MYPEEQDINDLKLEVGLLKKDNQQVMAITSKLSDSIEKIQEMNSNLLRMISLHDQQHDNHKRIESEMKEDIKELHSRITTTTRELHDKIDIVERHLAEKIDAITRELKRHETNDEQRNKNKVTDMLGKIENYKFLILGIALAAGFFLGNLNTGLLSILFK
jgi:ElaB/YqjD/DUF883 family membrane-anchored ribosome-binding protein